MTKVVAISKEEFIKLLLDIDNESIPSKELYKRLKEANTSEASADEIAIIGYRLALRYVKQKEYALAGECLATFCQGLDLQNAQWHITNDTILNPAQRFIAAQSFKRISPDDINAIMLSSSEFVVTLYDNNGKVFGDAELACLSYQTIKTMLKNHPELLMKFWKNQHHRQKILEHIGDFDEATLRKISDEDPTAAALINSALDKAGSSITRFLPLKRHVVSLATRADLLKISLTNAMNTGGNYSPFACQLAATDVDACAALLTDGFKSNTNLTLTKEVIEALNKTKVARSELFKVALANAINRGEDYSLFACELETVDANSCVALLTDGFKNKANFTLAKKVISTLTPRILADVLEKVLKENQEMKLCEDVDEEELLIRLLPHVFHDEATYKQYPMLSQYLLDLLAKEKFNQQDGVIDAWRKSNIDLLISISKDKLNKHHIARYSGFYCYINASFYRRASKGFLADTDKELQLLEIRPVDEIEVHLLGRAYQLFELGKAQTRLNAEFKEKYEAGAYLLKLCEQHVKNQPDIGNAIFVFRFLGYYKNADGAYVWDENKFHVYDDALHDVLINQTTVGLRPWIVRDILELKIANSKDKVRRWNILSIAYRIQQSVEKLEALKKEIDTELQKKPELKAELHGFYFNYYLAKMQSLFEQGKKIEEVKEEDCYQQMTLLLRTSKDETLNSLFSQFLAIYNKLDSAEHFASGKSPNADTNVCWLIAELMRENHLRLSDDNLCEQQMLRCKISRLYPPLASTCKATMYSAPSTVPASNPAPTQSPQMHFVDV